MNQQYPQSTTPPLVSPAPPASSENQKEAEWKNILSVVFLVLFSPLGLILMWLLANWSRKTKVIVTVVLGIIIIASIGILVAMVLIYLEAMEEAREAARDAVRKIDMRQIAIAQTMYHAKHGHFHIYNNNDAILTNDYPLSIPNFLPETPQDPLNEPPHVYYGIPNDANPQKFCYWTYLEDGTYYTATHAGNFVKTVAPTTLEDCAIADL